MQKLRHWKKEESILLSSCLTASEKIKKSSKSFCPLYKRGKKFATIENVNRKKALILDRQILNLSFSRYYLYRTPLYPMRYKKVKVQKARKALSLGFGM